MDRPEKRYEQALIISERQVTGFWNVRLGLTFLEHDGIVFVIPKGIPPGNRPWHQANADSHWSSERRMYATNEETNPPTRDGISDRLGVPVQAG